jgi:hypothetical protein
MPDFAIPDVDPELALPLGQIIIHRSTLEYLISILLGTFLSADLGGMTIVTNNVAVSVQSKWLRALMARHPHEAEHNKRVLDLLNRADQLRSERNDYIHGIWTTAGCEPKTALVETVNLERTEIIRSRHVTAQDLDGLVVHIDDWINDYVALGRELGFPRHRDGTKSIFAD